MGSEFVCADDKVVVFPSVSGIKKEPLHHSRVLRRSESFVDLARSSATETGILSIASLFFFIVDLARSSATYPGC